MKKLLLLATLLLYFNASAILLGPYTIISWKAVSGVTNYSVLTSSDNSTWRVLTNSVTHSNKINDLVILNWGVLTAIGNVPDMPVGTKDYFLGGANDGLNGGFCFPIPAMVAEQYFKVIANNGTNVVFTSHVVTQMNFPQIVITTNKSRVKPSTNFRIIY